MNLKPMALLVATALLALSLPTVTDPAAAKDATLVKSGATPQLAQRADHPAAYKLKKSKRKQPKK